MSDKRRPPRPSPQRVPSSHDLRKLAERAEKFEDDYAAITRRDHSLLTDPPTPLRSAIPSSLPPEQKREMRWIWKKGRWSVGVLVKGALFVAGGGLVSWLWHLLHKP